MITMATNVKRTGKRIRYGTQEQARYFCYGAGETRRIFRGVIDGKEMEFVKYNHCEIPLEEFIGRVMVYRIEYK